MKKKRTQEGLECQKWTKKHGKDTYSGGHCDSGDSDVEMKAETSSRDVGQGKGNQEGSTLGKGKSQGKGKGKPLGKGKGKPQGKGKCAACGSSTHQRSCHRNFPFNKGRGKKVDNPKNTALVFSDSSEEFSDSGSPDSHVADESGGGVCTCGAEGRTHNRGCPLSSRGRYPSRTLFPGPSAADTSADPSDLELEYAPSDSVTPAPSKEEKAEMKVGD